MTSTSVKDVGSVLNSLTTMVGNSAKTAAGSGFQTVLNSQTGRGASGSSADRAQAAVKKTPGDSVKAKDDHLARMKRQESAEGTGAEQDETGEVSSKKLEEIMAMLGTASADMMQEIADTFGISVEELQGIMQELGMETLDVLDQGKLSELLLKVAGVEDSYALVTDGELYDSYQELMAKLDSLLQETGEELGLEPGQLEAALEQLQDSDDSAEKVMRTESEEPVQVLDAEMNQTAEPETVPNAGRETESGRRHEHSDKGDNGSLFAQDMRNLFQTQFGTQVQQTAETSSPWSTDTQDIMRQIMDYMRIQLKPDTSSLEMQLHPESLGTLQIHLASKAGMVTANFIAQNEAVKAALESQMVQLKENFEQQGVKVEAIEVTVQSHAFERNLDQGRGQNSAQEQSPKRTRTRRIDLNDALEIENLEEEDALAAEMMAASGSQVDYTA